MKVYVAFISFKRALDKVDWEALWDVWKVYGVSGRLLDGVTVFYRDASTKPCVNVNKDMS